MDKVLTSLFSTCPPGWQLCGWAVACLTLGEKGTSGLKPVCACAVWHPARWGGVFYTVFSRTALPMIEAVKLPALSPLQQGWAVLELRIELVPSCLLLVLRILRGPTLQSSLNPLRNSPIRLT